MMCKLGKGVQLKGSDKDTTSAASNLMPTGTYSVFEISTGGI